MLDANSSMVSSNTLKCKVLQVWRDVTPFGLRRATLYACLARVNFIWRRCEAPHNGRQMAFARLKRISDGKFASTKDLSSITSPGTFFHYYSLIMPYCFFDCALFTLIITSRLRLITFARISLIFSHNSVEHLTVTAVVRWRWCKKWSLYLLFWF